MQQYTPIRNRYWLSHFLSCLVGCILAYFIVLPFKLTLAEYIPRAAFFIIVFTFVAAISYKHWSIEVKDGRLIGPGHQWKRLYFPVAEIDWSKSVPVKGWRRWINNDYIVSTAGLKITVHYTYTMQQRESLWQVLKQAQTDVGN